VTAAEAARSAFLDHVVEVARSLDGGLIRQLAARLEALPEAATAGERRELASGIAAPEARAVIDRLLGRWLDEAPGIAPAALALALRAADLTDRWHRQHQSVGLVWTGPLPSGSSVRRIDQALLEVVRAARRQLLIVSFAAYRIPAVHQALREALDRGVAIDLVLESLKESQGRVYPDPVRALDAELAQRVTVYHWPLERRDSLQTEQGSILCGLLHAKCALADGHTVLVSSANFTESALWVNMELGVLIRGGAFPEEVRRHFSRLREEGYLVDARVLAERAIG
jgi:cardiolipin synthase